MPNTAGNSDIVKRLLSGKSRCLMVGDSISVAFYSPWQKYWRGPIAGCGVIGGDCGFFGSGSDFDAASAALGTTSLLSTGNYSAFQTREIRFKGTTFGAVANALSNRFCEGEDPGGRWSATKSANVFENLDWTNLATDLQYQALIYRNATSSDRPSTYIMNGSTFAKIADMGTLTLSTGTPQHTLYTANFSAKPSGVAYKAEWQMPAGASVNLSHVAVAQMVVWSPSKTGLTMIPCSYSGHSVGKWLVDSIVTQAAITDSLSPLSVDTIWLSLTNNQPIVDGGGNAATSGSFATAPQYTLLLRQLVTRLRTACPTASIVFAPTYDTNNAGSGAHLAAYVDANYTVQQETPNSCFLNLFAAGGAWSQISAASLLTDGTHPNASGCAVMISRYEMLAEELAASRRVFGIGKAMI